MEPPIPRTPTEGSPWSPGVTVASQADLNAHLRKGGTARTPTGMAGDAYRASRLKDTYERLSALRYPPKTREAVMDQESYMARMAEDGDSMKKSASLMGGPILPGLAMGGMPVYTDPLNSPSRQGIPTWNEGMQEAELKNLQSLSRAWCKWYYRNHFLAPTCYNIYARYPFVGMDLHCPDPAIESEYKSLFLDLLNYEQLLPQAALQFWVTGEAAMFGEWDSSYKAWSDEQVLDSDYIDVKQWPVPTINREVYFWSPPESLKALLDEQDFNDPRYKSIYEEYGDYIEDWKQGKPNELPSETFNLLRHDRDINGERGVPILMRAFGVLMEEEKLNQAMTAVADRLYTPFIVAKLGGNDLLPEGEPWIPDQADLTAMQAQLEMVMASRYRLMVWHSGIQFENPLEGMNVPNLNEDFDRTAKYIAGVFGISLDLIYGGSAGTYAAGALSAETMMQNLASSQRTWTRWWIHDRAKRVAEERGYYVVEKKGQQLIKPTERVIERVWDGKRYRNKIVERRKYQLPGIRLETMDWRDQQEKFNNLLQLKRMGVFIPDSHLVAQADPTIDHGAMMDSYLQEEQEKAYVTQQLGGQHNQDQAGGAGGGAPGGMGGAPPAGRPPARNAPGGAQPGPPPAGQPGGAPGANGSPMPTPGDRPPQSDEQRANQPLQQAASLYLTENRPGEGSGGKITTAGKFDEATEEFSEEEQQKAAEKTANFRPGGEYAKEHNFTFLRRRGTKTGTLYFMEGMDLKARRVT